MCESFFAGILAFVFSIFPCVNNKVEYTCKEAVAVTAEFAENESVAIDTPKPVFAADMPKSENQKMKMFYLLDYLNRNTDMDHTVSMKDILEYLDSNGISAERKSIYSGQGSSLGLDLYS